jgi:predicted NBD/HSP70 family sugar kinase
VLSRFADCAPHAAEPSAGAAASVVSSRSARALAIGLAQLAHLYCPDVICVGGGVIDHHPELLRAASRSFEEFRSDLLPAHLTIERGPLTADQAGVIGAALLARQARAR